MAARPLLTRTWGTSMGRKRSTTSAAQPFSTAWGAKSWASKRAPGMQKNNPRSTFSRLLLVTEAISTDMSPLVSTR